MSFKIIALRATLGVCGALAIGLHSVPAQTTNTAAYPIDLPTVLRLAGAQNLDVQIARERLKEAEADRLSSRERFFPWIAPGISYHRRDGLAQAVPAGTIGEAHFQSYSPGVTLAAQLDLGDALYKSLAAQQLVNASSQALEVQRQAAILSAAKGYFDLAKASELMAVATEALKTSQDYQQQLHAAVETGIAFKGDELRLQTQSKQYQILLRQAVEQQRLAAVELARILDLDSKVAVFPVGNGLARVTLIDPNGSAADLLEQALSARPELKQSQALVSAARQNRNGAKYGPLIPSIGAQVFGGGLGGGPDGGSDKFGAEGDYLVNLSWRIGPGGLFDSGRTRGSKARLEAAILAEAKLRVDSNAQVVSGLARLQSLADQILLAEGKLSSASETLRLTRERKQYGVGIVLEDIQAQQELTRARSDYVGLIADFNKAEYSLSHALGSILAP
jgi:outer membrane protein TolC